VSHLGGLLRACSMSNLPIRIVDEVFAAPVI
jgi:hypothetical protein